MGSVRKDDIQEQASLSVSISFETAICVFAGLVGDGAAPFCDASEGREIIVCGHNFLHQSCSQELSREISRVWRRRPRLVRAASRAGAMKITFSFQ